MSDVAPGPARFATRLRLAIAGLAALVLLVAFASFWFGWQRFVVERRTAELAGHLSAIAAAEADQPAELADDSVRNQLLRVEARLLGAAVLVTDEAGAVLRSSEDSGTINTIEFARLGEPDAQGVRAATLTGATDTRLLAVAVPTGDGRFVVAVQRLSAVREAQTTLLQIASVSLLVAFAVAWFIGGVIARRLTRPLVSLEAAAERIAAGEFGAQVPEVGDAETVSLAHSFNRMSSRVADTYAAQEAFVADVSHEIRTPLTSIRGFAQAIGDGTVSEPEQRTKAAGVIVSETERIAELTSTLLALAQLDAGAVEVERLPVDVSVLVDGIEGRFAQEAVARGVTLRVVLDVEARPLGDADRLLQAVSTVVANALAFAPQGGTVEVRAGAVEGRWRLTVDDDGPGIPVESREAVFGRFAKADTARVRTDGGSGLGLSICRRLMDLMGGTVHVEDSPASGARLVLELPLAP